MVLTVRFGAKRDSRWIHFHPNGLSRSNVINCLKPELTFRNGMALSLAVFMINTHWCQMGIFHLKILAMGKTTRADISKESRLSFGKWKWMSFPDMARTLEREKSFWNGIHSAFRELLINGPMCWLGLGFGLRTILGVLSVQSVRQLFCVWDTNTHTHIHSDTLIHTPPLNNPTNGKT